MRHVFVLVISISFSFGQNYLDVLRPFLGQDVQNIGLGIYNSNCGTSDFNPASLTSVRQSSLKLSLHNNLPNATTRYLTNEASFADTINNSELFIPAFDAVFPIPVYRGSWVLGVSLSPLRYFNEATKINYSEHDTISNYMNKNDAGNLKSFTVSSGILFTPKLSLGASISHIWGQNKFSTVYQTENNTSFYHDTLSISPHYSGWNTKLAWMWEFNPYITFGGWLEMPSVLNVEERYYFKKESNISNEQSVDNIKYTLHGPYNIGHSLDLNGDPINLSIGLIYHGFSNMSMESNLLNELNGSLDNDVNNEIPDKLLSVYEWQFGSRLNLKAFSVSLGFSTMKNPKQTLTSKIQKYNASLTFPISQKLLFETSVQAQTQADKLLIISSLTNDTYAEINYNFVNILMGFRYDL